MYQPQRAVENNHRHVHAMRYNYGMISLIPTAHAVAKGAGYSVPNPLAIQSANELITFLTTEITQLVIPVAVILYVYAGFLYLTAGYDPSRTKRAGEIIKNTSIGLVIIFIGSGFVDLIKSILNAGN
jgi:type IV secretory pathway VirB2 component (pilin)